MIFLYASVGLILLLGYLIGHFVAAVIIAMLIFAVVWVGVMYALYTAANSDPVTRRRTIRDRSNRKR